MEKKRQRLYGFDFVRVICTLGIFMFHFAVESGSTFYGFYRHANGGWGGIFNSMFFILSGAMIYYNNDDVKNLGRFYLKRWLAIFPAFYLAWLYFYLRNAMGVHSFAFFANLPFWPTLFALDGYLGSLTGPNCYLVGEWFLGAIVLLYLIYPVFVKLFNKYTIAVTIILFAGWLWVYNTDVFSIYASQNFITCLFSFELGMLIMKYRDKMLNTLWLTVVSCIISVGLAFVPIPLEENMTGLIMGFFATIWVYNLGRIITSKESDNTDSRITVAKVLAYLSAVSYPFFLLHHQIIVRLMPRWDVSVLSGMLKGMLITVAVTFAGAVILNIVSGALCKLIKKVIIRT